MSSYPRPTKSDVVSDFRRGQILDAARQNFLRHGVAKTTVDAIARSAGVAKGTVYLYYASKDEILRHVLDGDLREFHDSTVPGIQGAGTVDERVNAFFRATLEFFDRKRDFFEHCHLEMTSAVRKKARQQLGLIYAAQSEAWTNALGAAGPAVQSADLSATARGLVSFAHGLAMQRLRGWHDASIDDTVASASALALKGLLTR